MNQLEVNCISKSSLDGAHEQITHIGNTTHQWKLTREAAISRITSRTEGYYTVNKSSGSVSYLGVIHEVGKPPYLRTYADGNWNDDLLNQAACDLNCKLIA